MNRLTTLYYWHAVLCGLCSLGAAIALGEIYTGLGPFPAWAVAGSVGAMSSCATHLALRITGHLGPRMEGEG